MRINLKLLSMTGFITCVALLAAAYYFEFALEMEPCPLCIMQRVATLMVALGCLASFFLTERPIALLIASGWTLLSSFFGIYLTHHHNWLQNLPADQVPSCGPSLEYMLDAFPIMEVVTVLLRGNGNCAEISWSFAGLSMPSLLMIFFIVFAFASSYGTFVAWKARK
ncbi:MAG: disulfide bond formation protein DsbB [Oleiphilaceae bacterium]|jgi:disulfide bond formation protein DsbB